MIVLCVIFLIIFSYGVINGLLKDGHMLEESSAAKPLVEQSASPLPDKVYESLHSMGSVSVGPELLDYEH